MAGRADTFLTEFAAPIAEKLREVYKFKSILSAGVVLFDRLSDSEKAIAIKEGNGIKSESPAKRRLQDAVDTIKEWSRAEREQPGIVIKILGPEGQAALDEFRRLAGPKLKKTKKKKSRG